jgi:phage tail sheath protein FI
MLFPQFMLAPCRVKDKKFSRQHQLPGIIVIFTFLLLVSSVSILQASPPVIEMTETSIVGFVGMAEKGPLNTPVLIQSWEAFSDTFGIYKPALSNPYLAPSVYGFFTNGGTSCYIVRVSSDSDLDYIGNDDPLANKRTGLQAFISIEDINIVCIPGVSSQSVQNAMISHSETMKDRLCILDTDQNADLGAVQTQRQGLVSANGYAVLYYPWIKVNLPGGGQDFVPPSGHAAGLYALTDTSQGVWKSPVGVLTDAVDVKVDITTQEQDILNPLGINCIRDFASQGIRVWGARTIASNPELIYISTRRLLIAIEESITGGTLWSMCQTNDSILWSALLSSVNTFLMDLWQLGAFQGAMSESAFFVNCGLGSSMTQDDIDNGRTILILGVAPVRPEEFILMSITHQRVDKDIDGVIDACDNCPDTANPDQADTDADGIGDVCDNCLDTANTEQTDIDGDGIGNSCDNCDAVPNPNQLDADNDNIGDLCDSSPGCGGCGQLDCEIPSDVDNDGIPDLEDNCPDTCNTNQLDADNDGTGDVCDGSPGCGGGNCGSSEPDCETEC